MRYGYARVSTIKQGKDGFSLEDQQAKLKEAGAEVVYSDIYTGKEMSRPEFDKLMKTIQEGDTFIVCKLDRFARTATEGSLMIQELQEKGVTVHVLNMGIVDGSPMGKLLMTVLLAFAEFERDQIVERTQTGKARARENGVRVDGRPKKFNQVQVSHALELVHAGNSYNQVVQMTGISRSTLLRAEREWKKSQI